MLPQSDEWTESHTYCGIHGLAEIKIVDIVLADGSILLDTIIETSKEVNSKKCYEEKTSNLEGCCAE